MTTTFKRYDDYFNALPPERQEHIRAEAQQIMAAMQLTKLRKKQKTTQREVAARMGVSQANISQLEMQGDMQLSTLLRYVHAIGATIDLQAVLPDGSRVTVLNG
jgi:predicted XRE-type DNA-binding protein